MREHVNKYKRHYFAGLLLAVFSALVILAQAVA